MNEAFVPYRRPIDPSAEPPFRLGGLKVSPATLELSFGDRTEMLEPRVMQVLVALHDRLDEAVSRDDLSQLCWGGRIVGEDALNRSISRLRKTLAVEPSIVIDTIPKIGYRLRVLQDASATETDAMPVGAATAGDSAPKRRPLSVVLISSLVAIGATIAAAAWWNQPRNWSAQEVRPLTRDSGVETAPALPPDGHALAYAAGPGSGHARDIYLRGLTVGDTAPLAITSTPEDETSPAWSPDNRRLAFVRQIAGEPCAIVVTSPPKGLERIVGRCQSSGTTTLTWFGRDELVFADRSSPSAPRRLFRLNVASGAVAPITSPPAHMVGDAAPVSSPDGTRIAFRRTAALGSDDVFVVDPATGAEQALTNEGWKALGLAWSPDSKSIFISSNRGGDFGLWALDPNGVRAPRRVSLGLLPLGQMSADRKGRLAVQVSRMRANLGVLAGSGSAIALTSVSGMDWDPNAAPDGSLVYGSDISGTNEIWLKRPQDEPVRLTSLRGSYVHSPRWSPDGREIAFVGVKGGHSDIFAMAADGSRLRRLTTDGIGKGSIVWTYRPGEFLYSQRTTSGWQAMRLAPDAQTPTPLARGRDIAILRRGPDGTIYARAANDDRLLIVDPAENRPPRRLNLRVPDLEAWEPARDGIYWLRDAKTPSAALWFTDWSGASRLVSGIKAAPRPNFTVRQADNALITPQLVHEESDLLLLELKPE